MSELSWPELNEFSMLLTNNNRSKAYLQNLITNGFVPSHVVVLDSCNKILPEHTESDLRSYSVTNQRLIRTCKEADISFDEKEHIQRTLQSSNIPHQILHTIDVNSTQVVDAIKYSPGKYVVYSGTGGTILRSEILSVGKYFLHVHPGWLPAFRGSTVQYYSILLGESIACSVITFAREIDKGPIFYRRKFEISPDIDLDYVFDPAIRTASLIDFFRLFNGKSPKPILVGHEDSDQFYIIHPLLKHISFLSIQANSLQC
jgi:methionyl-tRNA formyltransferase